MSRHVSLRIATYNIHRCRGLDRRTDPSRIAEVVASLEADIIALQEVIGPGAEGHGPGRGDRRRCSGMTPVMAPTRLLRGRPYGNAIIGRFPVCGHHRHDLTWRGREARGCQRVDLQIGKGVLHVYNVHLGTALLERRDQAVHLRGSSTRRPPASPASSSATSTSGCAGRRPASSPSASTASTCAGS